MNLQKGHLFHDRYLLVAPLGQGASADVWRAKDTKANNLVVALKIFAENAEMDTYGMQNFKREFTTVYNMKHSNLLPPTGYDICDGHPYLVMQYCENGSCSSMVERMEEEDIIKFLHDVAAGLEYLHDHNIIHQDIKPDNILLDDNCNFMVTDFGISATATEGSDGGGMSGGTQAYMAPERFTGTTTSASDVWSLGATIVELITGTPPYGDHGGLLQTEGEPLPELPKLQPEVASLIMGCLVLDPTKRITAYEIRQKIELYWETGSWVKHSSRNTILIAVTAAASLLLCLGIFLWDYNRTKIHYYKDYAEHYGVPSGIGRISPFTMGHRSQTYRFEYQKHKLRRVSLVNSAGKVIGQTDSENIASRQSDVRYFYTDNGQIDYTAIYNQYGKLLYRMDYDDNLKTATFRLDDEHHTEMNLDASTNVLYKDNKGIFETKSRISRYLLTYDDEGRVVERRYAGLQNVPACDKDNIYGSRIAYDSKGRRIEETFIGIDGNVTSNSDGLAIREYTYDDDDNWTSVTYLNAERQASHDGNNCTHVTLDYDKYGNRIRERYFTLDGTTPSIRTDDIVAGYSYEYDDNGNRTMISCLDVDGNLTYCKKGCVSVQTAYNADGYTTEQKYLDENGNLVLFTDNDGDSFSIQRYVTDEKGIPIEMSFFDDTDQPMELSSGVHRFVITVDDKGNVTELKYFDKDGQPTTYDGFNHSCRKEYDNLNNLVRESYYDKDGNPTTCNGIISTFVYEYNRQCAVTKLSLLDAKGRLVNCANHFAGYSIEYDEIGNQKAAEFFDDQGKPVMSGDGHSRVEYVYDPKTNFLVMTKYLNTSGKVIKDTRNKYDARGNVVEEYTLVDGRLPQDQAVVHYEYDDNNRIVTMWYTDLSGNKASRPGYGYCTEKRKYDIMGNCTMSTFWKADGSPGIEEHKTHKRVREFDNMNRNISEKNFGSDGKPLTGTDVNPESRVKYDQWGNIVEKTCYDGYGNPRLCADGYFMQKMEYNRRRQVIVLEYFDVKGQLTVIKSLGYAKIINAYDNHGNITESKYYDASKLLWSETCTFNDKNNILEMRVLGPDGKLSDQKYGASRVVFTYDEAGTTYRTRKFYNQSGTLVATQVWNDKTGEWDNTSGSAASQASAASSAGNSGSSWQEAVRSAAVACPQKVDDGLYIQSISFNSSSITVKIKTTEISKYDGSFNESDAKDACQNMKQYLRDEWNVPSRVSITVVLLDKADRVICSV